MTRPFILPLLAVLLTGTTRAEPAPDTRPATARAAGLLPKSEVDRFVRPLVDGEWCTGVVVGLLTEEGSVVYGYGRVSAADGRTPDGDTVYEIGSVSKVFTALLLAARVRDGRMGLDDPVQKYLPDSVTLPRRGGKDITLLQLATHTSGLPRMPGNFRPKDVTNPYADYTVDQMYAFLAACKPARDPGQGYEYSNLAMGLLGHVLARDVGSGYEELLVERVAKPLGMRDTRITLGDDLKKRLAPGHDPGGGPVPNWDLPALAGAGAIRSTASDLLKFLSAQVGTAKADADLTAAIRMTHERRAAAEAGTDVALGWHIDTANGFLWHGGQTGGYHAYVGFSPAHKAGVVVLANTANGVADEAAVGLLRRLTGRPADPPDAPKAIAVEPKVLDRYVGPYVSVAGLFTIARKDDRLYAQLTGQPAARIYPESPTRFFWKGVDARVDFVRGAENRVVKLVLHQNGKDLTAWRLRPGGAPEAGGAAEE